MTSLGEWDVDEAGDVGPVDVTGLVEARDAAAVDPDPADPEPTLMYGSVDEFVRMVLLEMYRRRVGPRGQHRWSAQWWKNAEAIVRLEAMWRAWEHLRRDGALGLSVWFLHHADPMMLVLLSPEGPFATSDDTNRPGEPLPYEAPPEGLFPDVRLDPTTG